MHLTGCLLESNLSLKPLSHCPCFHVRLTKALERQAPAPNRAASTAQHLAADAIGSLSTVIGDDEGRMVIMQRPWDRKHGDVLPPATSKEMCGELAAVLGLLAPWQWQARCQLLGMLAVAYTTHGSGDWVADAEHVLRDAEQVR